MLGLLRIALAWIPALCVKAQKPVMGLLKGVLTSTASATMSSICKELDDFGDSAYKHLPP